MTRKIVMASAAGILLSATPAMADTAPRGATMMSDAEMDSVVAGAEIVVNVGMNLPNGKQRHNLTNGPAKLLSGEGPDNNGVEAFELDITPPIFPPGLSVRVNGSRVGNGNGVVFFTTTVITP